MARILIVDDEESDRLFERSVLQDAGHTLFFAADGEAAHKVYDENEVDLVITDLVMPRVNGLRLIRELKEKHPDVVIIAVSGVAADQLVVASDLGAVRTLYKPVRPSLLLAAVDAALSSAGSSDPWSRRLGKLRTLSGGVRLRDRRQRASSFVSRNRSSPYPCAGIPIGRNMTVA